MSVEPNFSCRLCGEYTLQKIIETDRSPASVERLLMKPELSEDGPVSLRIFQCTHCDLVQLTDIMPDDYYEDYEMAVSFSPRFVTYLRELVEYFTSITGLRCGRIAEIGCGDGTFMGILKEKGFTVTGVEPSNRFREKAVASGFEVHKRYISSVVTVPGAPYDAIVCRQVLEHVPDINGFLSGMKQSLAPGGFALIEVPSLEIAVSDGRFHDFFPDHVNYFSHAALCSALEFHGFQVLDVQQTFQGEFNTIVVRLEAEQLFLKTTPWRGQQSELGSIFLAIEGISDLLDNFFAKCRREKLRVVVWGSGGKGISTLAVAGISAENGPAYVVDSDPRKQALYMPVSHFKVYPPERLNYDPVDVVLVTALAHIDEIIETLRTDLEFSGEVFALGTTLEVVGGTKTIK
jgi:SAM-dependent methyltransferase